MELLNEIWQTARRNKLRTSLTGFAVAWGIFMLIVLLGAGNGLINANLKQSDRFLSSSMVVFGGWTSKPYQGLKEGRDIRLHESDMEITAKEFSQNVDEVGAQYNTSATISLGQQYISTSISGVYPNHTKINKVEMLHGRFINEIDVKESRKVLVVGNKQAKELLNSQFTIHNAQSTMHDAQLASLIGQFVNVGTLAFKVVGIYKEQENGRSDAFSSYTAIKRIFGANTDDAGRIEFTFHGSARPSGLWDCSRCCQVLWVCRTSCSSPSRSAPMIANEYMDATIGHETIDTGLFKATMFLDPTVGLDVCIEATMVMIIAGTIAGLIPAFKASRIRPIEALRAE